MRASHTGHALTIGARGRIRTGRQLHAKQHKQERLLPFYMLLRKLPFLAAHIVQKAGLEPATFGASEPHALAI